METLKLYANHRIIASKESSHPFCYYNYNLLISEVNPNPHAMLSFITGYICSAFKPSNHKENVSNPFKVFYYIISLNEITVQSTIAYYISSQKSNHDIFPYPLPRFA